MATLPKDWAALHLRETIGETPEARARRQASLVEHMRAQERAHVRRILGIVFSWLLAVMVCAMAGTVAADYFGAVHLGLSERFGLRERVVTPEPETVATATAIPVAAAPAPAQLVTAPEPEPADAAPAAAPVAIVVADPAPDQARTHRLQDKVSRLKDGLRIITQERDEKARDLDAQDQILNGTWRPGRASRNADGCIAAYARNAAVIPSLKPYSNQWIAYDRAQQNLSAAIANARTRSTEDQQFIAMQNERLVKAKAEMDAAQKALSSP